MTTTDPYADAFDAYWNAGWRGVLPLPYRAKKHPPSGYTGRGYTEPSYADCAAWAADGPSNIALHLPKGVIGIDVDNYGDKGGGATLAQLVEECGPLPPTWLSTSRGDGISGIRLYRVPDNIELIGGLAGIEIIQYSHRYVVCWPSIHPEGMTYGWYDEARGDICGVPPVDSLPMLPDAWIVRLVKTSDTVDKSDVDDLAVATFTAGMPTGEPCRHIIAGSGLAMRDKSRHDAYNDAVLAVVSSGRSGCPGAVGALRRLRESFVAEITTGKDARATVGEAQAEWKRSLVGAVAIATTEHPEQGQSCPDDYMAELIMAQTDQDDDNTDDGDDAAEAAELAYRKQVARKAAELQLLDDAREILATRKAGKAPDLDAQPLGAFLAQPDEIVPYRIHGLWPVDGRVLLAAAAKAGKTTLVTNLLKALADGGLFLDCFEVTPLEAGKTIVYLNMEVSAAQIRRWLRRSGIVNVDLIHVVNLRGTASALTLGSEQGRQRVADWLRGLNAGMVILDPLAPLLATLGIEENDNSGIAQFFSLWGETLALAGVTDDLIVHHTGHAGQRSRGAARFLDEPDALWTISKDTALDEDGDDVYQAQEPRFFKATGRDVEQAEQPLIYDGATGVLTLGEGSRKAIRAAAKHDRIQAAILGRLRQGEATQNDLTRKLGLNYNDAKQTLDALVDEGVVVRSKLGQAMRYTLLTDLTDTRHRHQHQPLVSVTDTTLYRGVSESVGADTGTTTCESCGNDTGYAAAKYCKACADRRAQGDGL